MTSLQDFLDQAQKDTIARREETLRAIDERRRARGEDKADRRFSAIIKWFVLPVALIIGALFLYSSFGGR